MNNSARISKPAVAAILDKYLDKELAEKMYFEMVEQDTDDMKHIVGMTCREFMERFDDYISVVWADDTKAGFGKRGDPVSGDLNDCIICCVNYHGLNEKVLEVWSEGLKTDKAFINAALEVYKKRQEAKA